MTEADILETTYTDRMDVYRRANVRDENGISRKELVKVCDGIKCALSKSGLQVIGDDSIKSSFKIFCRPTVDIKAGDMIEVHRGEQRFKLTAGEVLNRFSHLDIECERKERV